MDTNSRFNNVLAPLSRRGFFGRVAVAGAGLMLSSAIPAKSLADEECEEWGLCDFPVPIPHLTTTPFGQFHFFPGPVEGTATPTDPTGAHPDGRDPSMIFNFEGFIGQADLNLTGIGTNLVSGEIGRYQFHTDMRFIKGRFVGTDGIRRRGTFVVI